MVCFAGSDSKATARKALKRKKGMSIKKMKKGGRVSGCCKMSKYSANQKGPSLLPHLNAERGGGKRKGKKKKE